TSDTTSDTTSTTCRARRRAVDHPGRTGDTIVTAATPTTTAVRVDAEPPPATTALRIARPRQPDGTACAAGTRSPSSQSTARQSTTHQSPGSRSPAGESIGGQSAVACTRADADRCIDPVHDEPAVVATRSRPR
ncbi:MAG: hypothetical protein ABJ381_01100, partial [Ilumatobacter sp.]